MLKGKELGEAIAQAIVRKGVTKKAFADAMGVKPASVQDWIKYGRLSKDRINNLVGYFSDVVEPSYWGFDFDVVVVGGNHETVAVVEAKVHSGSDDAGRIQLEQYIQALRAAFDTGRLTQARLRAMQNLLRAMLDPDTEMVLINPGDVPAKPDEQQIRTRNANAGKKRRLTPTGAG